MVFTLLHDKKRKEKESIPMNKISRKGFLKIAAAAAMSGVTAGALALSLIHIFLFMQLPGGSGFLPFSPFCELF